MRTCFTNLYKLNMENFADSQVNDIISIVTCNSQIQQNAHGCQLVHHYPQYFNLYTQSIIISAAFSNKQRLLLCIEFFAQGNSNKTTQAHICTHTSTHKYTSTYTGAHIHTQTHAHTHIHTQTHTYSHIVTQAHTQIHTQNNIQLQN